MNPRANRQNFQADTGGLVEFLSNLFRGGIRTNASARAGGGAHLSAPAQVMNSTVIPNGPGIGGTQAPMIPNGPGPGGTGLAGVVPDNRVNPMDVLAQVQAAASPGVDPMTILAQTNAQAGMAPSTVATPDVVPGAVRSNEDFMNSLRDDMTAKPVPKKKTAKKSSTKRKAKRKPIVPAAPIKNEVQAAINNASGVPSGPSHKDRLAMLNAGYGADDDFGITY